MAIEGISLSEVQRHVSKYDPDPDNPTVWLYGALPAPIRKEIEDKIRDIQVKRSDTDAQPVTVVSIRAGEANVDIFRFGCRGWENFPVDGGLLEFQTRPEKRGRRSHEVVSEDVLGHVPAEIIDELADLIWGASTLGPAEKKESGSQSSELPPGLSVAAAVLSNASQEAATETQNEQS